MVPEPPYRSEAYVPNIQTSGGTWVHSRGGPKSIQPVERGLSVATVPFHAGGERQRNSSSVVRESALSPPASGPLLARALPRGAETSPNRGSCSHGSPCGDAIQHSTRWGRQRQPHRFYAARTSSAECIADTPPALLRVSRPDRRPSHSEARCPSNCDRRNLYSPSWLKN